MHLGWLVAVLVAIVTGLIDGEGGCAVQGAIPMYSLKAWGVLTLLHDLAALLAVFDLVRVFRDIRRSAYLRDGLQLGLRGPARARPDRVARGD
jgi:hypothetical protein